MLTLWTNRTNRWIIGVTSADVIMAFGPNTGLAKAPIILETCPTKAAAAMALISWSSKTGLKRGRMVESRGSAVREHIFGNDWMDEGEE
jgi:hypothetical protein